jgi:hypothetical protein
MSFIVKGIDIPKGTDGLSITFHGQDEATETHILDATQAVQLPKDHGRLGDLDYLYDRFKANKCPDENVYRLIKEEPTILGAEGAE